MKVVVPIKNIQAGCPKEVNKEGEGSIDTPLKSKSLLFTENVKNMVA